jgi:sirohydrochlorin cobaltochelatase
MSTPRPLAALPDPIASAGAAPAILLVAHGDRGDSPRNQALASLCQTLAHRLAPARIGFAVINGEPMVACGTMALDLARGDRLIVVPVFMSEGYFTRVKLPRELALAGHPEATILPPLGASPMLVERIDARLRAAVGAPNGGMPILLCAHGSRSGVPDSRQATLAVRDALAARGWTDTACAFVEEPPAIAESIAERPPVAVVGLFASLGTHALDDVAAEVAGQSSVRLFIPAIGAEREMADIAEALLRERLPLGRID